MARWLGRVSAAWGAVLLAVLLSASPAAAVSSPEPAPTPGCVFTGGAFTCGGAMPPDLTPAPPDRQTPPRPQPVEPPPPAPAPEPVPAPAPTPSSGVQPTPSPTSSDTLLGLRDGDQPQVAFWIAAAAGTAAVIAAVAGLAFSAARTREENDEEPD
ncbi:hypothetical protein [Microbacterium atlanticum]|uniref:hypothetical protein n=1 Tax=Microbacterium atlanticum TaxID=2782168 RepID=UPI0018898E75|nr:hypothetical protein [Microbacterium atlanticum]